MFLSMTDFTLHAQVMMLQDERLQPGHFIKFLGTLHDNQHGGVEAMYASLPKCPNGNSAAILVPSIGAELGEAHPQTAATDPGLSATAAAAETPSWEGHAAASLPSQTCVSDGAPLQTSTEGGAPAAAGETAAAQSQPNASVGGHGLLPKRRETGLEQASKAVEQLTATFQRLAAKHPDADDSFFEHAVAICNLAQGQLQRLDVAALVTSTAALNFITNPDAPAGFSKARLKPHISPKKKCKGKSKPEARLAAESPEKPEASRFYVPKKQKLSMMEEAGKEQTAGMRQKAERAEAAARAKVTAAKKHPLGRAVAKADDHGSQAMSGVFTGGSDGKENASSVANLLDMQQPASVLGLYAPPHSERATIANQAGAKEKSFTGSGTACTDGLALAAPLPMLEPAEESRATKRRAVKQPAWLSDSVV